MKTLHEEALAHQNDMSMEDWSKVLVSDEESYVHHYTPSSFGPCCTNGCQYCHPNCHEQFDSSNYY